MPSGDFAWRTYNVTISLIACWHCSICQFGLQYYPPIKKESGICSRSLHYLSLVLLVVFKKAVTMEPIPVTPSKEPAIAPAFSLTVNTTTIHATIEPIPKIKAKRIPRRLSLASIFASICSIDCRCAACFSAIWMIRSAAPGTTSS